MVVGEQLLPKKGRSRFLGSMILSSVAKALKSSIQAREKIASNSYSRIEFDVPGLGAKMHLRPVLESHASVPSRSPEPLMRSPRLCTPRLSAIVVFAVMLILSWIVLAQS